MSSFNLVKLFLFMLEILAIFRTSLFNLNISVNKTKAKIKTKIERKGSTSIFYLFSFSFALFFSCQPSKIGKNNSITQPTASTATAHSKLFINQSRVNQSNI